MLPASEQFIALANTEMDVCGCTWDQAWERTRAKHLQLYAEMSGGRRPVVALENERASREYLEAKAKQGQAQKLFIANVHAKMEKTGMPYDQCWRLAQSEYVALANEAFAPVFGPQNLALLNLSGIASQDEARAVWEANSSRFEPRAPKAMWNGLLSFHRGKPGKSEDELARYCAQRHPELAKAALGEAEALSLIITPQQNEVPPIGLGNCANPIGMVGPSLPFHR